MLTTALIVFMEGINPLILRILEARDITSYEEAIIIATKKETLCEKIDNSINNNRLFNINELPFINHNRTSNKNHIKYNRCSKMGHYPN